MGLDKTENICYTRSMANTKIPWVALEAIRSAGGVPLLVGGAVRDLIIDQVSRGVDFNVDYDFLEKSKDLDFEVYGLSLAELQKVLEGFGEVDLIGKSFGILKLHDFQNVDFSLPRKDNKVGIGHKGFEVDLNQHMTIAEAAKRRDLTINSMALDLFTFQLDDSRGGVADIKAKVLRAADPVTFLDDPLRALRVAQFVSRFGFKPDQELRDLCAKAELSELPGERMFVEFEKLLLGKFPARGLEFLHLSGLLKFFPELAALEGCEQDPQWHPEGSVLVHSMLAVQEARKLTDDLTVLWAVLCHDLGKPGTTVNEAGRVKSHGHEEAGVEPTKAFLGRLRASNELINKVVALVNRHLAPAHFFGLKAARGEKSTIHRAGPGAFRRLARELGNAGTNLQTLELVSRADQLGRTTSDALAGVFAAGDWFKTISESLNVSQAGRTDVVQGRHLIARGRTPGPEFGKILSACREFQDETGADNPEAILDQVLSRASS